MTLRRIAVVTGTRADYGLLYWLIHDLHQAADFELQLVVTGMHLMPRFGRTVEMIERDGFPIAATVDLALESDAPHAVARAIGTGTAGFADAFARLAPDLVVILGDRFEALAAATAAYAQRRPIAHLHGGELTEGALDDGFRHAITKLSALHFTAAQPYRRRVIQMGEPPERVFNVGAPGLEHLVRTPLLARAELERALDFPLGETAFLVTFHPATLDEGDPADQCRELLAALDAFAQAQIVITLPNADPGGQAIIALLEDYARRHPQRCRLFAALGQQHYLSLLRCVHAVVGNSSSGLIEAPSAGCATVNVGKRQRGRLRAASVIDCAPRRADIEAALRRALDPGFRAGLARVRNPYGDGAVAGRILAVLRQVEFRALLHKPFYDVEVTAHA
ncbi:MAG: UDP-N-acetylglucosamine 2-epimerase [Tepidimonas sp.]|uniref:UDP-N-acetylglucosamine 2-epimerase n=1 Tax=Tepidimonas sp. TaxID=2002775 RepID=UPI004054E446